MTPTATTDDVAPLLAWMAEWLRTEYAPQKIILFGSYAYGTPQPDSDIDLLIIKETGVGFLIVGCVYDTCCPIPNAQYR